jgi:hypothetical protein
VLGYPAEKLTDFLKTIRLIYDNRKHISVVNTGETLSVIPDTPLYEDPTKFGIKTDKNGDIIYDENGDWLSIDGKSCGKLRRKRLMILRRFLDLFGIVRTPKREPVQPASQSRSSFFSDLSAKIKMKSFGAFLSLYFLPQRLRGADPTTK